MNRNRDFDLPYQETDLVEFFRAKRKHQRKIKIVRILEPEVEPLEQPSSPTMAEEIEYLTASMDKLIKVVVSFTNEN